MPCFHVGCKSGYGNNYKKCHLFKLPTKASEDVKLEWIRNIPKQLGKNFDIKYSRLCDLHFDDKYIIKKLWVKYGDRMEISGDRKKWKLTNDAVPTQFENDKCSPIYNRTSLKRKSPRERSHIETKIQNLNSENSINACKLTTNVDLPDPIPIPSIYLRQQEIILPPGWYLAPKAHTPRRIMMYKFGRRTENYFLEIVKSVEVCETQTEENMVHVKFNNNTVTVPTEFKNPSSIEGINSLLDLVEKMHCCVGVKGFEQVLKLKTATLRSDVWFSNSCAGMVDIKDRKCEKCVKMLSVLRNARYRENLKANVSHRVKTTPSNTGHSIQYVRYLKNCIHRREQNMRRLQRKSSRDRLALMLLRRQMSAKPEKDMLSNIQASSIPKNLKLAVKTAIRNAKRKSKYGHRYESDWLLQCMLLKIRSPNAYRYLRGNNALPLPHPSTLQRLIQGLPCQFGFNDYIFDLFRKEYFNKSLKQREGILMFDEMKVREELRFDKFNYKFNGFVDFGGKEGDTTEPKSSELADHALVFMFKSQLCKTIQPLGAFATRGAAPGNVLAKLLLACVTRLESSNVRVSRVVADGATTNKNMWKSFGIVGSIRKTTNKILHPCAKSDESRYLYFFCDVPHLVKCIRNNLFKHKSVLYRGKSINSGFYEAVFDLDKVHPAGLRVVPKLTEAHISPTSFQKMKVSLATQVMSRSMATGINFYRTRGEKILKNSESTEEFTLAINDLFDCLNARHFGARVKLNSKEYETIETFKNWLNVDNNSFASTVTMVSLRVTLQSFLDIIAYWTKLGFDYVLTGKVSQDSLEKFFGILRHVSGDEDHPTVTSFLHLYRLLCIYSPTARLVRGNVSTSEDEPLALANYADVLLRQSKKASEVSKMRRQVIDDEILSKIISYNFHVEPKIQQGLKKI